MMAMVAVGVGLGAAMFAALWFTVPHRPTISVQLARFDARPATGLADSPGESVVGMRGRLGRMLALWLARRGITYPSLRQNLALTGRTFEEVMARKVLAFVTGFFLIITLAVLLQASTGLTMPVASPALLGMGVAAALSFVPDLQERRTARERRRELRRAVGSWLDLVALEMAGSAAPAEALPTAARVGTTWPMHVLADTLYRATTSGQNHWDALTDLGHRTGVLELIDLATLTQFVGRDGAQVRDTLTARATSMRRAQLADIESNAGQADQSMLVAQILIGFGFIIFVLYPAIANVLAF